MQAKNRQHRRWKLVIPTSLTLTLDQGKPRFAIMPTWEAVPEVRSSATASATINSRKNMDGFRQNRHYLFDDQLVAPLVVLCRLAVRIPLLLGLAALQRQCCKNAKSHYTPHAQTYRTLSTMAREMPAKRLKYQAPDVRPRFLCKYSP